MTLFGRREPSDVMVREAAWIARCVGRSDTVPLQKEDVDAMAAYIDKRFYEKGSVLSAASKPPLGVCIVQAGLVELSVGSGRSRVVVQLMHPGDVDGDVQLLMGMPAAYTTRALMGTHCLLIKPSSFEELLKERPAIARRWLSSIAGRLVGVQQRLLDMLGKTLPQQLAVLLLSEDRDGRVPLPQRTLAAMLGVHRPSVNRVLKRFESEGRIALGYGEIKIPDRKALENV